MNSQAFGHPGTEPRWPHSGKDAIVTAIAGDAEFTLAVGFGYQQHGAMVAVTESLSIPFETHFQTFERHWNEACNDRDDLLAAHSGDDGKLYRQSHRLLLAHEDKTYKEQRSPR